MCDMLGGWSVVANVSYGKSERKGGNCKQRNSTGGPIYKQAAKEGAWEANNVAKGILSLKRHKTHARLETPRQDRRKRQQAAPAIVCAAPPP